VAKCFTAPSASGFHPDDQCVKQDRPKVSDECEEKEIRKDGVRRPQGRIQHGILRVGYPAGASAWHRPGFRIPTPRLDCKRNLGKVPQVLLFAPLDQETRDVHVHVHPEVPIRNSRIHVPRVIQAEKRRSNVGTRAADPAAFTTAVRRPDRAICQASNLPPAPLPRIRISNRSA
jgi:hypothetical protein